MKTTRGFRPSLQPLEGRVVLSFSLPKVLHSIFPFIKDTTRPKPIHGEASVYQHLPAGHAASHDAHTHAHAHPPHVAAHPHAAVARHHATGGRNGRTA